MKSLGLLRNIAARSRTSRASNQSQRLLSVYSSRASIETLRKNDPLFSRGSTSANWNLCQLQSFSASAAPATPVPLSSSDEGERLRFEEMDVHPKSLKALRRKGLHTMTEIQEKTFVAATNGSDVLGRARTGTGKTLAFLLPGLERILRNPIPDQVNMLVLSPTRELAEQISDQAKMLLNSHPKEMVSQVIYGGAPKREDLRRFEETVPTILVATPGRLKDHLASTKIHGIPFINYMKQLQVLVLDETDRLLDMGFRQDIEDIVSCLPRDRQTLLFSATIPREVRSVIQYATKPNLVTVDCMEDKDPATHTNSMTEQSHVILPPSRFLTGPVEVLLDLVDNPKNKVMVFFPMTSLVQLYSNLFSMQLGRRVMELHGKMEQRHRTRISQKFRNSKSGTLFTSDVSARGVDYPDVTHVLQFGAAETRETYIHRLGRTGRAGKKGKGILLLPEIEKRYLYELDGLEIPIDTKLQAKMNAPPSKRVMDELGPIAQDVRAGRKNSLAEAASDSYHAMVAYYFQRAQKRQSNDDELVDSINSLVVDVGLKELPGIPFPRAKRLQIDRVPGLNIERGWNDKKDWASGESWVKPSGPRETSDTGGLENNSRPPFRERRGRSDSVGDGGYRGGQNGRSKSSPPRNSGDVKSERGDSPKNERRDGPRRESSVDSTSQRRRNSFSSGSSSFGGGNSRGGQKERSPSFSDDFFSNRRESFHGKGDSPRRQPDSNFSSPRKSNSFPSGPQWKKDAMSLDSSKQDKSSPSSNTLGKIKSGSFTRWDSLKK
jgi:ATP-dependent RNA helicase MSS116, mitochondrial